MQSQTTKTNPKKSFITHIDSLDILDELTDEQAGKLFKTIKAFHRKQEIETNEIIKMIFIPFKNQYVRDNEKYAEFVKEQSEKGKKSAELRKATNSTTVNNGQPLSTDSTYKEIIKDKENYKEKENESENNNTPAHFLDFSYSFTDYDNVDESIKTITNKDAWVSWQSFNKYIDENCKNIRQISQQMNLNEYLVYRDRFIKSGFISADKLKPMLTKFNNHKPTIEKSISVYPALCSWTEREYKK